MTQLNLTNEQYFTDVGMNDAFTKGINSGKLCYRGKQEFEAGWVAAFALLEYNDDLRKAITQNGRDIMTDMLWNLSKEGLGSPFSEILHDNLWELYDD